MNRREFEVRKPGDSDIPGMLNLLRDVLGEGEIPWSRDLWRWKHRDNPFGISSERIAVGDGRIIGVRVFMRCELAAGGRRIRCARPVDTATHPEWRRQGVFSAMTRDIIRELRTDGVSLVFNTPNEKSEAANLSLGWSQVGRIPLAVRIVRPFRVLRSRLLRDDRISPDESGNDIWEYHSERSEVAIASVGEFLASSEAETIIEGSLTPDDSYAIPVSTEYLRWRYGDIPPLDYHVAWDSSGEAWALVIYRATRRRGLTALRVCEVVMGRAPSAPTTVRGLIREMVEGLAPDYLLSVDPRAMRLAPQFYSMGFIPIPSSGPVLVARRLQEGAGDTLDPFAKDSWSLQLGSFEVY